MRAVTIVLFAALLSGACASPGTIGIAPEAAAPEDPQRYAASVSFRSGGDPVADEPISRAMAACERRQWDAAIDILADAAPAAPESLRGTYLAFLDQFTIDSFPVAHACRRLIELDTADRPRYEKLLASAEAAPFFLEIPPEPVALPWLGGCGVDGLAVVEASVNGRMLRLAVDTGAQSVAIFADAAARAGVVALPGVAVPVADATGRTGSGATSIGLVENMRIGGLAVRDCRAYLPAHPKALAGIDGVIGWPVLSQVAVVFDKRAGKVVFERSSGVRAPISNFMWLAYPMVKCGSSPGAETRLFYMGLDTGADHSYFGPEMIKSLAVRGDAAGRTTTYGVNGPNTVATVRLRDVVVALDGRLVRFGRFLNRERSVGFFAVSGVLGLDLAACGQVRLDFQAGRLSLVPY